ncbi:hypothetical protein C9J12_29735 [Photobacterium frigidiphilum]|uniref:Uncharacterized protein n=1 Tax=Photobacterium frigidiphilum TaxID=264736 RepID=A0A2T3J5N5_9GAMM|nr:DUF6155 family protein [Photobacterium frigidiphilum]PSU41187.1 hypothetical protein C9J12_29735 [Photobacterium frigidiphilum]
MSLQKLRVILRHKSEKELIDEIADLYKKFDAVKRYYKASLLNDDEDVFNFSMAKIEKAMQPKFTADAYLPTYKIAEAKKAISEYKKVSSNDHGIARLMLFYVEVCINIINEHDYIEKVWSSGISTFEAVIKFIKQMDLGVDMRESIEKVIRLPNEHNEMNYALARIYERTIIKD